ncbi:DMT family transporter [Thalassococcus sp. S3]|uniref:DMT family transporter n=1 Tax=Thalassococcus sp. S3 TaxID=2017482 RepID=UPI0010240AAE|nr:DMT family transporter [Thalassococcus sp. S3]QBF33951.1 EamA family transporter [Thalassococcus sp. S3]
MTARITALPLLCGLFVVLWSSGFVGAKFGLDYAGTFTVLFWRYVLVVAVLGLIVTLTRNWQRIPRGVLLRHMVVGALAHAAWLASVLGAIDLGLSAGLAAFITALQPIMTGALSVRMTGERVSAREWMGLGLGLLAVAIVIGDGLALGGSVLAYLLPFVAVIAITIASLIDRSANVDGGPKIPLVLVTFWHCTASLLVLTPLAIGLEGLRADWSVGLVFSIIWLALVVSLAAYGLMFVLLRQLPAARVASLTYLSPPVTMIMAWALFGETLNEAALLGLVVAALSVGLTLTARVVPVPATERCTPPASDDLPPRRSTCRNERVRKMI